MHESSEFKAQRTYISRISHDAIQALQMLYLNGSRAREFSSNSILHQSADDLAQSILSCRYLIEEGLLNPARRELRYLIESSVKYLYIDQTNPGTKIEEKITALANLDSSIDVRKTLKLDGMHEADASYFLNEIYDAYRDCCAYVHTSKRQTQERLDQAMRGGALGFETTEDLRKIGRLLFRIYDMVIVLYAHGCGLSLAGDVFVSVLDDIESWKFHKGKYTAVLSAYFDYKHERNMRKYGESRPWNPEDWPPRRLGVSDA